MHMAALFLNVCFVSAGASCLTLEAQSPRIEAIVRYCTKLPILVDIVAIASYSDCFREVRLRAFEHIVYLRLGL